MIKSIRIRNFKSLRDVTVDLEPITVLVGRGGTGKTNFVNAIAFLRDCLLRKHKAFQDCGGPQQLTCATSEPRQTDGQWAPVQFDVQFTIPGEHGEFVYHLSMLSAPSNPQFGSESLIRGDTTIFSREDNQWVTPPAVNPLPQPVPIALELASGIPEVGLAYVILTAGIGCYDFSGSVLKSVPKRHKRNQLNPADRPVEREKRGEAGLRDDASNFLDCFVAIKRNLQKVSAQQEMIVALRKLKPALRDVGIAFPARDRVTVSLKAEASNTNVVLELSQESEGFRRFLAHLIALNQVPPKVLVTFEEPEKGLYPGAMSALAEQIRTFPEMSGGQVILTTHSPLLLDHFAPHQIRVVEMENLETKIGQVSSPQMEALREQLETTGELLTVDPARLA